MSIGVIISITTLAISVLTIFVKFAYDYSKIATRLLEDEKDIIQLQKQIADLYNSRMEINMKLVENAGLTTTIKERLDRIETKIDLLSQRGV